MLTQDTAPPHAGLSTSFDFLWSIFKRHYLSVFYPEICRKLCICHVPNVPAVIEAGPDGSKYASPFFLLLSSVQLCRCYVSDSSLMNI